MRPKANPVKVGRAILILAVAAVAVAETPGISGRRHDEQKLKHWTLEQAIPSSRSPPPQRGARPANSFCPAMSKPLTRPPFMAR